MKRAVLVFDVQFQKLAMFYFFFRASAGDLVGHSGRCFFELVTACKQYDRQ